MKTLVLGAGAHVYEKLPNHTYVDIFPFQNIDTVFDLNEKRWPWRDLEYTRIQAIHLVEHLSSLVNFMDECHRVLSIGGTLYLETPLAGANPDLEFCDPTHVRCYRKHTFTNYFTVEGIAKFGYTQNAWSILHLDVKDDCIIFHGMAIK